jgi:hypothetical protein
MLVTRAMMAKPINAKTTSGVTPSTSARLIRFHCQKPFGESIIKKTIKKLESVTIIPQIPLVRMFAPGLNHLIRLLRWDKPTGRLILLVPALWSLVLASGGRPPWDLLVVVVLGAVATSAAGCVVNDLWDHRLDAQVQRTAQRPLAQGHIPLWLAGAVALVGFACAYGLAQYLNPLAFALAVLAVPSRG